MVAIRKDSPAITTHETHDAATKPTITVTTVDTVTKRSELGNDPLADAMILSQATVPKKANRESSTLIKQVIKSAYGPSTTFKLSEPRVTSFQELSESLEKGVVGDTKPTDAEIDNVVDFAMGQLGEDHKIRIVDWHDGAKTGQAVAIPTEDAGGYVILSFQFAAAAPGAKSHQ